MTTTQIREDTWKILTQKQPQQKQQHIQEAISPLNAPEYVTFVDTFPKIYAAMNKELNTSLEEGEGFVDIVKVLVNVVKLVINDPQRYECSIDLDAYNEFIKFCVDEAKSQSNEQQVSPWVRNDQNGGTIIASDYQVRDAESTKRNRILGKVLKEVNYLTGPANVPNQTLMTQQQSSVAQLDLGELINKIFLSFFKIFKKLDNNAENNAQQIENASNQLLNDISALQTPAIPNIGQAAVTALEQTKNEEVYPEPDSQANGLELNLKGDYLIWPANPPFFTNTTMNNIIAAEKIISSGKVPQSNVFVYVPRAGGDGDFSSSCLDIYLHSKKGVGSQMKSKKGFAGITSVKTFVLQIKNAYSSAKATEEAPAAPTSNQGQKPAAPDPTAKTVPALPPQKEHTMTPRERMLARLFEDKEGEKTIQGEGQHSQAQTTAVAQGQQRNMITIWCTPRVKKDFLAQKKLFDDIGLVLNLPDNDMTDDNEALSGGKKVYQDILSFINGEKTGSAGAEDTKVAMKSAGSLKEADEQPKDAKQEPQQAEQQQPQKEEKPDPAKGKWDWSYIKTNTAAKQVIQKIFADVELLKKGFDDGGNPNKMFLAAKAAATEYAKKWAAALGDGGDMMLEGVGMGWIVPAFKKGVEKLRTAEEEYQGIEAFIRSDKSNTLLSLLEDPDTYIEYGSETGGKS